MLQFNKFSSVFLGGYTVVLRAAKREGNDNSIIKNNLVMFKAVKLEGQRNAGRLRGNIG